MRRSPVTVAATLAFGAAFLLWTLLLPTFVDDLWPHSPVSDRSVAVSYTHLTLPTIYSV